MLQTCGRTATAYQVYDDFGPVRKAEKPGNSGSAFLFIFLWLAGLLWLTEIMGWFGY